MVTKYNKLNWNLIYLLNIYFLFVYIVFVFSPSNGQTLALIFVVIGIVSGAVVLIFFILLRSDGLVRRLTRLHLPDHKTMEELR
jgi:hypothetical protein